MPSGLRSRVPAKITSSMRAPRRLLADCSPSTQLMASLMFDLPQPLGPTMAAMPSPLKRSSVRSQNDLNPCSSTVSVSAKLHLASFRGSCNHTKRVSGKSKVPRPHLVVARFDEAPRYGGRARRAGTRSRGHAPVAIALQSRAIWARASLERRGGPLENRRFGTASSRTRRAMMPAVSQSLLRTSWTKSRPL